MNPTVNPAGPAPGAAAPPKGRAPKANAAKPAARRRVRVAEGIYKDRHGLAATVKVNGVQREVRFPHGTPLKTIRARRDENQMGSVEGYTRRVKRWRGGQMIQRWVASALVEAEPRFRRVRGYRDLRYLVGALDALAPPDGAVAAVA